MKLKNIVPWGRNFDEYRSMFCFSDKDLKGKILSCGDGPASFNAEAKEFGFDVVSIDPIYAFTKDEIKSSIDESSDIIIKQLEENADNFVWKNIKNPNHLYKIRIDAMKRFLNDFEIGKKEGRYIDASLPYLSFDDSEFDLALSSHFLFLYSEHLDEEFHLKSILEMLRVAKEVRVFPLITLNGDKSPHLNNIIDKLNQKGYMIEFVVSDYEFQKGGFLMLKITR